MLAWVHVRGQLHVVGGEEPHLPVDLALPPVRVVFVEDVDDLALAEGQLVVVLGAVVVHADHLAHCRERRGLRWLRWSDFARARAQKFYIIRGEPAYLALLPTGLQLSFPPTAWVLFSDQNQLTRGQGELLGTSSCVAGDNLCNFRFFFLNSLFSQQFQSPLNL